MTVKLTENIIRSLASAQSFEKGRDYYRSGAIYNTARQGNLLLGECEGSTAPSYHLQAELDAGGVLSASCTCPYDWGGYCKHIVALLLTYIHKPDEFVERRGVTDMLAGLDRDSLAGLIVKMVDHAPEMYDWLETAIPPAGVSAKGSGAQPREKRRTQVSEQAYRRQVKNILRASNRYDYDEYGDLSDVVEQLDEVRDAAYQFLDAGDPEGALTILKALLDEVADDYENFYDEGDLAGFVDSLGMPLAEAILSAEWSDAERGEMKKWLEEAEAEISDYSDGGLDVALAAIEYGWESPPPVEAADEETYADWDEDGVEDDAADWEITGDDLTQAQLNVLERQGRMDEFLALAQRANAFLRYILKLLDLGRKDEAMAVAMSQPITAGDAFAVAQKLRDLGCLPDAIAIGERGLSSSGQKYHLATWLAPLEEAQGRKAQALQAYQTAFDESASFELYKTLQRLSGAGWNDLKPHLMEKLIASPNPSQLADVYLYEKDWDAAIQLAEKYPWGYTLLEKVADAVIPHRPEWVIRVSIKQAEGLIEKTQSKLYPTAANWLAKAKKAYLQAGRKADWDAYLASLRTTYARRPALQAALRSL